jgi:hypothetical protein
LQQSEQYLTLLSRQLIENISGGQAFETFLATRGPP